MPGHGGWIKNHPVCGDCTTDNTCEDCHSDEDPKTEKVSRCKREGCAGPLKYINGAYRCEDCWKTYFINEID